MSVRAVTLILLFSVLEQVDSALRCAQCDAVHDMYKCNDVITCRDGEVCYVEEFYSHLTRTDIYAAGCALQTRCHEDSGFLFQSSISKTKCCKQDMCNTISPSSFEKTTMTSTTTTVIPTSPPTTRPHYQLHQGIRCGMCSGPECGLEGHEESIICPNDFPYCKNVVINSNNGDKMITKSCGSLDECMVYWINNSSLRAECTHYDPAEIYPTSFECQYCCETQGCNRDIVPRAETLLVWE